jgi:Tripartite tricarboxylate transporter TctB family
MMGGSMQLRNPKDFWAGVLFMAIGAAFAIVIKVYEYPLGTTRSMGPGYFPLVIALLLALLGIIIVAKSLVTSGEPVSKFAWRPIIWILGGVVLFGLTAKTIGLALAIVLLVLVSAFGGHEFKIKEQLTAAVILAIGSVLVFVIGLKLPFPIWPDFLS